MSKLDQTTESDYYDSHWRKVTVADVLQKLREELTVHRAALADAKRAIQHLEVAIAAIERDEAESKKQIDRQRPVNRRGYLTNGVIDALRDGIAAPSAIVSYLGRRGIETTQPSVSNAIQRLQEKKQVRWDLKSRKWVLAENSGSFDENEANKVSAPDVASGAGNGTVVVSMGAHSQQT